MAKTCGLHIVILTDLGKINMHEAHLLEREHRLPINESKKHKMKWKSWMGLLSGWLDENSGLVVVSRKELKNKTAWKVV